MEYFYKKDLLKRDKQSLILYLLQNIDITIRNKQTISDTIWYGVQVPRLDR